MTSTPFEIPFTEGVFISTYKEVWLEIDSSSLQTTNSDLKLMYVFRDYTYNHGEKGKIALNLTVYDTKGSLTQGL